MPANTTTSSGDTNANTQPPAPENKLDKICSLIDSYGDEQVGSELDQREEEEQKIWKIFAEHIQNIKKRRQELLERRSEGEAWRNVNEKIRQCFARDQPRY